MAALIATLAAAWFGLLAIQRVFADAGNPTTITATPDAGNPLQITVSGNWGWDCSGDDKMVGWAVSWGEDLTINTLPKTGDDLHMGEAGSYPSTQGNHVFSPLDSKGPANCGSSGTWGPLTHTYAASGTYEICVVIYDVHYDWTTKTKLNGAINNSVTTFTVDSTTGILAGDAISIDNEQMKVTAVNSGTSLSVTRGFSGTTATSHNDNKDVKLRALKNASGNHSDLAGGPSRNTDNSIEENFNDTENCAAQRIVVEEPKGNIVVRKVGNFAAGLVGGGFSGPVTGPSSYSSSWNADVGGSDTKNVVAGTGYAVSENTTGFPLTVTGGSVNGATYKVLASPTDTCDSGTFSATAPSGLTVTAGQDTIVCVKNVFTETVKETGSIKVIKVVTNVPNDPTSFGGTITSASQTENWSDSETTDGAAVTGLSLDVAYTVTETNVPNGYYAGGVAYVVDEDGVCEEGLPVSYTTIPPSVTLTSQTPNKVVCVYNQRLTGRIVVAKVKDPAVSAVDTTTEFGGAVNGPLNGSWGPILIGGEDWVDTEFYTGTYTITEDAPGNGWALVGFALGELIDGEIPDCPSDPAGYDLAGFEFEIGEGRPLICVMNTKGEVLAGSNLLIRKVTTDGQDAPTNFTGGVAGPSSGSWSANNGDLDASFSGINPGTYTVTENPKTGYSLLGYKEVLLASNTAPAVCPAAGGPYADGVVTVGAEETRLVCVYNQPLLGHLIIKKVNQGGADGDGFTADITGGTQNIAFSEAATSAPQSLAAGAYTVTEDAKAGYEQLGWAIQAGAACPPGPTSAGAAASATVASAADTTVCFYNRPFITIKVHKTEVRNGNAKDGSNWTFTLSGCGITPRAAQTSSQGNIEWTNVPAAISASGVACAYTVTETTQPDWTVSPGDTQTTGITSGSVTLTFINTRNDACVDGCFTILTTPTPPPPPPTPTATATRPPFTPTPKIEEEVEGVKTPGALSTPIAPSTGTGATGGDGGTTILVVLLGLVIASGGLAVLTLGRTRGS